MNANRLKLGLALWASLAVAGVAAPVATAQDRVKPEVQEIGLLFTQTADRGSLRAVSGRGYYTHVLELAGASRQVVWFSDRPARNTGHIPVRGFMRSWEGFGFNEDPPNAALTLLDAATHQDTIVVTLGRGRYIRRGSRVRYPARIVTEATGNLAHLESARDKRVPQRFGRASLFVDDAEGQVVGGCLIQPYASCRLFELSYVDLFGTNLSHADLAGSDLTGAELGVTNLTGADLSWAALSGADLTLADLSSANLSNATLENAKLPRADLSNADLSNADLSSANLSYADLSSANLSEVYFVSANLTGANLSGAKLSGAVFCQTTMPDGSISGC